jgi:hypothetical protein
MDLGEVAFQVDLAAALIAVVAFVCSIRSGARRRRRISFLEQHR